jgi:hypothetical protein
VLSIAKSSSISKIYNNGNTQISQPSQVINLKTTLSSLFSTKQKARQAEQQLLLLTMAQNSISKNQKSTLSSLADYDSQMVVTSTNHMPDIPLSPKMPITKMQMIGVQVLCYEQPILLIATKDD